MTNTTPIGFTIVELSDRDREILANGKPNQPISLGDHNQTIQIFLLEVNLNGLITELKKVSQKAYILAWEGGKVPRGAIVDGHTIGWTQNGQVIAEDGKFIGVYDRLMEYGGESKKQHQMIIFLFKNPTS